MSNRAGIFTTVQRNRSPKNKFIPAHPNWLISFDEAKQMSIKNKDQEVFLHIKY